MRLQPIKVNQRSRHPSSCNGDPIHEVQRVITEVFNIGDLGDEQSYFTSIHN